MEHAPDSRYFSSLRQKAHEGAICQSRVDVAEAQWHGNVGVAERQGNEAREIAKIDAETSVQKTERDTERAKAIALLATRQAAFNRDVEIAQIEATRATESRNEDLRKQVEIKRAETEIEKLRALDVVKATIQREAKQQSVDAKAYEVTKNANPRKSFFFYQIQEVFAKISENYTMIKKQPMLVPMRWR